MIKLLELFGGIGACTQAFKRIGVPFEVVDYVEIDKYAVQSYNAINGTNFEPQDITKWDKDLEVDFIMHGSPCQDFSVAGKGAGGDENSGTRSSLMYETLRIVNKLKPKYVLWENVKNLLSTKHKHNFDKYIEIMNEGGYNSYYQVLNAKDYGIPQNRERVFTLSIRKDIDKGYSFPLKEKLELRLKDMLEDNVEEKYYLSDKQIERIQTTSYTSGGFEQRVRQENGICNTLAARDYKDPKCIQVAQLPYFNYESDGRVYSPSGINPTLRSKEPNNKIDENDTILVLGNYSPSNYDASRIVDIKGIAPTVKENHGTVTGIMEEPFIVASRGRNPENPNSRVAGEHTEQRLEPNTKGISNCITSVQKDNYVMESCLKIKETTKAGYKEAYAGDGVNISGRMKYQRGNVQKEMTQTLMTNGSERGVVTPNMRIRKLTPKECWRLMGFSDEAFDKAEQSGVSNSQLYKQAGNSIVVNVLEKILRELFVGEQ